MTTPAVPVQPNALASIDEVELWGRYWLHARGHMREVVVVSSSPRVRVAFWVHFGTRSQALRRQTVRYPQLKRLKPVVRQPGFVLEVPAPTRAWVEEVDRERQAELAKRTFGRRGKSPKEEA